MYVIIISNFNYVGAINSTFTTTNATTTTITKIIINFIDYVGFINYNAVSLKLDLVMIKDYYKMSFLHLFIS